MVATPCFGGMVTQRYMKSVMELMLHGVRCGLAVSVELLGDNSLIPRARNALVAKFLDHPGGDASAVHRRRYRLRGGAGAAHARVRAGCGGGHDPLKLIGWAEAAMRRARAGEPLETAGLRYLGAACEGADWQQRDGFVTADYAGDRLHAAAPCGAPENDRGLSRDALQLRPHRRGTECEA